MSYQPKNILDVLVRAAQVAPEKGMTIIPQGHTKSTPERITYSQLLQKAGVLSRLVRTIPGVKPDSIILLHLDNHRDNILWLWAIVAAGLVPAVSTPFTNDLDQRKKHLLHLKDVLRDPVVITREKLVSEFAIIDGSLPIHTIESLASQVRNVPGNSSTLLEEGMSKSSESIFALMLTSGSTGHAKAVVLRHGQVVSALFGKSAFHQTTGDDVFLNWIGMDHVANLTEIHLHAMYLASEQVHVHAVDVIAQPMLYLQLIERYAASYSFAPNFFLASVRKAVQAFSPTEKNPLPDISSMRSLISGGEANPTGLAASLSQLLAKLGAPAHFIRPGFGMTETCAGSIYNVECPTFDLTHGREFTSLGHCIPGMKMRVTRPGADGLDVPLKANEVGNLEVTGANVFNQYFNNPEATASSFTPDGWFITGDLACIDEGGNLHLVGREKETIIINGVKYFPHEVEGAIEDAAIAGVTPSFVAVFPHRPKNADSETVCVVYLPSYGKTDDAARLQTRGAIRNVVMKHCMARPYKIIPLDKIFLPKTALGKLSRNKIRKAFESGVYDESISFDEERIARVKDANLVPPSTQSEIALHEIFADVFELSPAEFGIHTNFYDLGCSSLEVFRLKWRLQNTPGFPTSIPITRIISNPTIASLTAALDTSNTANGTTPKPYDPVVVLRTGGTKPPLWLVHPGVGEVLVFLNLARHITDRPVYALRARGFDGEPFFGSLDEMAETYLAAIKRVQPSGPYAIAGYSFGGTVAFEIAKMLRAEPYGDEVPFLAVFDQPPHIKQRMRVGGWVDVLLTLARFFNLLPDEVAEEKVAARLNSLVLASGNGAGEGDTERDELVDVLLAESSEERLEEFGLDKKRLATWTSLALNSHVIARDYEPAGKVPLLEVFYGQPITAVAATVEEWKETKLSRWGEFVDDVQFHQVEGHHYTMIAPEHVGSFVRALTARLSARGV
ncbi:hypothetical protein VMCG_01024 [Cytospora schulzeri]|uniref:Carrier domain-containing protein n=1 Tax=Cytospora schulzeri TaxID=448051 RepID=A0A423X6A6_9PEZI|nr:hypothetical protein VMCG_01024 [Valsa malicola]